MIERWRLEKMSYLHRLYLSRLVNRPLVKPRTVTLTLTSRCNLRCVMCSHWRINPATELNLKTAKKLIDQTAEWGISEIDLSGGEPLCYSHFDEILEYADNRNIGVNITTNATLIDENMAKRVADSSVSRIQVSIDGPDPETHDRIRGVKGCFKRAVDSVRMLKALDGNLKINLTTVVMSHNLDQISSMPEFAQKHKFESVTFQPVNDDNLNIGKHSEWNELRVTDFEKLDEEINKLVALKGDTRIISNSVNYLESIKRYFRNQRLNRIKCYAGFVVGIVTPDAKLWTCKGSHSDLNRISLRDAWNSEEMRKKRILIKKCTADCMYPCYLESDADTLLDATLSALR